MYDNDFDISFVNNFENNFDNISLNINYGSLQNYSPYKEYDPEYFDIKLIFDYV